MHYLIFTREGYDAFTDDTTPTEDLTLWLNPGVANDEELIGWQALGVNVRCFETPVDASREAEVLAAVEHVEAQCPEAEVHVEYR